MKDFSYKLLLIIAGTFFLQQASAQLYINEWMAANATTIEDGADEFDDWIEIYNAGNQDVNLNGYYISDDPLEPLKFQITEDLIVKDDDFLLLWADNDLDQGDDHVSIKLSADGEFISIYSPSQVLVDSISFPAQIPDVSMGRYEDGENQILFFTTPTPEESNDASGLEGTVENPTFSIQGGFFDDDIAVELSSATPGATIYYTTNGDDPTTDDDEYDGPVDISETTMLRAIAVKDNFFNSGRASQSYFIEQNYTLPVVSIITDPDNMFDEDEGIYANPTREGSNWERFCQIQYFKEENLEFSIDCGIRIQGRSSVTLPKKSFRLFFDSDYGQKWLEYPLFEDSKVDRFRNIVLRSGYDDSLADDEGTLLREPFGNRRYAKSGGLSSAGNWAILTINGEFWGIYEVRESINDHFIETHEEWDEDEFDLIRFDKPGPEVKAGSIDDWLAMQAFLENNDLSDPAIYAQAEQMIDMENLVNLLAFNNNFSYNSWSWGVFAYKKKTANGKWRFMVWDLDRGLDQYKLETFKNYERTGDFQWANFMPFALIENEGFTHQMLNRTADLLNTDYRTDIAIDYLYTIRDEIIAEMPKEFDRWDDTRDVNDWNTSIDTLLEEFFTLRPGRLRDNALDYFDLPDINQIDLDVVGNGSLHINTIDVPTIPWSGIYFEEVPVTLTATAGPGSTFSHWSDSDLTDDRIIEIDFEDTYELTAHFTEGSTDIHDIVISEINYHSSDILDAGDWIELYNNSDQTADLSIWYFQDEGGNYFNLPEGTTIPPFGYLVLAEELALFSAAYPDVDNVIGDFGNSIFGGFKLSNDGEIININNANASFSDEVPYNDQLPWPVEPDGNGPTLQLISPDFDNALADSWVNSLATPGGPYVLGNTIISINCPNNINVNAPIGLSSTIVSWNEPSLFSNCPNANATAIQTGGLTNNSSFPIGTTAVQYSASDNCENTSSCFFTVTVNGQDATLNFSCPDNITVSSLVGSSGAIVNWDSPNASSDCSIGNATLDQSAGLSNGSEFPLGTSTVSYQAQDPCDNNQNCNFTVTVEQEALVAEIDCQDDIIITAAPGANQIQVNWDIPQGSTNCELASSQIVQSEGPENGSFLPIGTTTITYTLISGCDTEVTCSFDVTVLFQEAILEFSCPENVSVNALIGATSAVATWDEPNATSNCSLGNASFEQTTALESGDDFPIGITTVSYEAQDVCDNNQNCSFTVSVEQETLVAEINCQDDLILTAAPGADQMEVSWDIPQGSTNCEIVSSQIVQSEGPENGSFLPIGTTTITYTLISGCDTEVTCSFDVIVQFQEAILEFSCPENITVNALIGATSAVATWNEPNATSNCSLGNASFEQTTALESGDDFPIGITTVSYEAQDICDNNQNCSFTVTVEQEALVAQINCQDDIILTAAPGANQMQVNWDIPQGSTNCEIASSQIVQSEGPENGSFLPIGTTTITYTLISGCDTEVTCSFDIVIQFQETLLEFSCPENLTVNALIGANSVQVIWDQPNASTNCSLGNATFEQTSGPQNETSFPVGTTTITYQAQDLCDNSQNCSFTVTVTQEELNSEINCPENMTLDAPIGTSGMTVTWPEPEGNTNCEIGQTMLEQTSGPVSGSFLPVGTTTIEYTYSACDENVVCSFDVTVNGQEAVLNFSCPDNILVTAPIGSTEIEVTWDEPEANSDCSLGEASFTQMIGLENGTPFPIGTTTITYQATDACENQSDCSFDVIVVEEELIANFNCPNDLEFSVPVGTTSLVVNWPEPEGNTNCQLGSPVINQVSGPENGAAIPLGMSTVMYQFDTGCETELLCSFNINIVLDSTTSTSVMTSFAQQLKLFPNPANQILNIDLGNISNEVENILVYNSLGQKMIDKIEQVQSMPAIRIMDLEDLSSGIYIVLFQMKNSKNISKQFVIQR